MLSAIFFKEKFGVSKLLALVIAFAGCVLVSGLNMGGIKPEGIFFGLMSGLAYALYSIFGRAALNKYSSLTVTTYTFIVSGICVLFFCNVPHIVRTASASPSALLSIILLVLISTVIPYLLYTAGLRNTEAGKASVMASVEPVVATAIGIIVYKEALTLPAVIGAALVLASVTLLNIPEHRKQTH